MSDALYLNGEINALETQWLLVGKFCYAKADGIVVYMIYTIFSYCLRFTSGRLLVDVQSSLEESNQYMLLYDDQGSLLNNPK